MTDETRAKLIMDALCLGTPDTKTDEESGQIISFLNLDIQGDRRDLLIDTLLTLLVV